MSRLTRDAWALELAQVTARRSTCLRRAVGCVLLNARGHVLATGYNGVARGQPHCNEVVQEPVHGLEYIQRWNGVETSVQDCIGFIQTHPHACLGAEAPSGTQLDACQAIHAEQNALLQCSDPYAIEAAYVTASPCITCAKLLLNTSCSLIVFAEEYPHPAARDLWLAAGRDWTQLKPKV